MKLTIEQPKLSHILAQAASVVERKNTIPILANVMLTAEDGNLTATATDLDIEVSTRTPADVETDGAITVNAVMLFDIVKRLPKGGVVTIYTDKRDLHIDAGRSKFNLATLPTNDYPRMADDTYETTAIMPAASLLELFNRTSFAMSTEETRYYLCGVYMHNDASGFISTVSTDGHRLAKMVSEMTDTVSGVIVPRKTVAELRKLLVDGDVTLETSETKIRVTNGDFTIVSKVIDGTFPDYMRVIPKGNHHTATMSARAFSDASSRVVLVSDERTKGVKLYLTSDKCTLTVTGATGKAVEEVDIDYDGPDMDIGLNSKYLAETMAQAENGEVTLRLGGSMDAVIIEPSGVDGFVAIQMPMRL